MFRGPFDGFCSGLGGYSPIGMIFGLVVVIGLIVGLLLLVWLWRRAGSGHPQAPAAIQPQSSGVSAKEVLQVRYARGEITREQYLQMLADLG